jgi:hypothetical protein
MLRPIVQSWAGPFALSSNTNHATSPGAYVVGIAWVHPSKIFFPYSYMSDTEIIDPTVQKITQRNRRKR